MIFNYIMGLRRHATVIPPCSSALGLLFHAVYNIHTGSRHSILYSVYNYKRRERYISVHYPERVVCCICCAINRIQMLFSNRAIFMIAWLLLPLSSSADITSPTNLIVINIQQLGWGDVGLYSPWSGNTSLLRKVIITSLLAVCMT